MDKKGNLFINSTLSFLSFLFSMPHHWCYRSVDAVDPEKIATFAPPFYKARKEKPA